MTPSGADRSPRTAADELRDWLAWAGKRLAGVPQPSIVDRIEREARREDVTPWAWREPKEPFEIECDLCGGLVRVVNNFSPMGDYLDQTVTPLREAAAPADEAVRAAGCCEHGIVHQGLGHRACCLHGSHPQARAALAAQGASDEVEG